MSFIRRFHCSQNSSLQKLFKRPGPAEAKWAKCSTIHCGVLKTREVCPLVGSGGMPPPPPEKFWISGLLRSFLMQSRDKRARVGRPAAKCSHSACYRILVLKALANLEKAWLPITHELAERALSQHGC